MILLELVYSCMVRGPEENAVTKDRPQPRAVAHTHSRFTPPPCSCTHLCVITPTRATPSYIPSPCLTACETTSRARMSMH